MTPVTTPAVRPEIGVRKSTIEFANRRSLVTVLKARSLVHPPSPATGRFHARTGTDPQGEPTGQEPRDTTGPPAPHRHSRRPPNGPVADIRQAPDRRQTGTMTNT
ncbi:hypothetical protein GCM10018779_26420 [Streptomyces griseocarneus]|nr:hypothetical protein GCM10018779_26420 [Streptomyces griseocarneus]